jgi:hypothetical protein
MELDGAVNRRRNGRRQAAAGAVEKILQYLCGSICVGGRRRSKTR